MGEQEAAIQPSSSGVSVSKWRLYNRRLLIWIGASDLCKCDAGGGNSSRQSRRRRSRQPSLEGGVVTRGDMLLLLLLLLLCRVELSLQPLVAIESRQESVSLAEVCLDC